MIILLENEAQLIKVLKVLVHVRNQLDFFLLMTRDNRVVEI